MNIDDIKPVISYDNGLSKENKLKNRALILSLFLRILFTHKEKKIFSSIKLYFYKEIIQLYI